MSKELKKERIEELRGCGLYEGMTLLEPELQALCDMARRAPPTDQERADAQRWLEFNVNDKVRFKITEFGRSKIAEKDAELNRFITERGGAPLGSRFTPDADGWCETQLWCLMEDLGPHIRLGAVDVPFETTIRLPSAALKAAKDAGDRVHFLTTLCDMALASLSLKEDAERFRYLQNIPVVEAQAFFWNWPSRKQRAKEIDAAIDAARRASDKLTEQDGEAGEGVISEAEHMMDLLLAEAKMHRVGSEQCVLLTDAARLIERLAAPSQTNRKEP